MVITPGHSQPILSTGFEGDFSLTLGRLSLLSPSVRLSFLGFCRAAVGKGGKIACFPCLGSFLLMVLWAAWDASSFLRWEILSHMAAMASLSLSALCYVHRCFTFRVKQYDWLFYPSVVFTLTLIFIAVPCGLCLDCISISQWDNPVKPILLVK